MDLHIHTPASSDYQQMNISILDILQRAESKGIDILAITDHNTFKFITSVQDEAKKSSADLVVLPGIEITLQEGAHILAIFDTDFDEKKQTHFLGTLKIPVDGSVKTPS